jgi:NADPH:quinone reductase-like Zn-dependent oxidoreductase
MGITSDAYATMTKTAASRVMKIPEDLSFEEAAGMPCVYPTVVHSLINLTRLESGQSVLIHSACGGVGLAALYVCQMLGVSEVYATVGSPEKVKYLMDTFGLPPSRIFSSRDASFLPGVMRETAGRGVDVVLNSLSGELLHASVRYHSPGSLFGCTHTS